MNIPTAEELLIEEAKKFSSPLTPEALTLLVINVANQHALNHVQSALEEASQKAKITYEYWGNTGSEYCDESVDKNSILNSYPLTNIK